MQKEERERDIDRGKEGETVGGGNFFIFSRRENGQSYLPDCLALAAAKVVTVVEADHGSAFNPH